MFQGEKLEPKKPILITGLHRSGSTWCGKMVSLSKDVGYIHEPFHILHRPGICSAQFKYWFTYIIDKNENEYLNAFKKTLNYKYSYINEIKSFKIKTFPKDIIRLLRDSLIFSNYRIRNVRPLLKDPIALLSAEWLAERFDMDVIIMIRHPAAFISSLKRMNWTYSFDHLLDQELLMNDLLVPFEDQIRDYSKNEHDIIDQGILLWNILHSVILNYKEKYKNWLFVRHEDLSSDPLNGFKGIFHYLGLDFTKRIERKILKFSCSNNPKEFNAKSDSIKRDSKANIWNWKNRLTKEEILRIKKGVNNISTKFYDEQIWDE